MFFLIIFIKQFLVKNYNSDKKIITTEIKEYKNSRKNTKILEKIRKFKKKKYECDKSMKKSARDKKMK
jgi:hypothetical protein